MHLATTIFYLIECSDEKNLYFCNLLSVDTVIDLCSFEVTFEHKNYFVEVDYGV